MPLIPDAWSQLIWGRTFCASSVRNLKSWGDKWNRVDLSFTDGLDGVPVRKLLQRILPLLPNESRHPEQHLAVLQHIVLQIGQALTEEAAQGQPCVVGFIQQTGFYRRADGAELPGQRTVVGVIDALAKLGLIQVTPSRVLGRCSYFVPTSALFSLLPLDEELIEIRGTRNRVRVMTKREVVYDVDATGQLIKQTVLSSYRPVLNLSPRQIQEVAVVRRELEAISDHADRFYYLVCDRDDRWVTLDRREMHPHVVFNDSSTRRGGRLYMGIQNQPQRDRRSAVVKALAVDHPEVKAYQFKPIRQTLHIGRRSRDGQPGTEPLPTVELDYDSLHVRMAYQLVGLDLAGDGHVVPLPGWTLPDCYSDAEKVEIHREMTKLCGLSLFNTGDPEKTAERNRASAVSTFTHLYQKDFLPAHPDCAFPVNPKAKPKARRKYAFGPSDLVQAFLDHHAPVAGLMFHGWGKYFQYLDGTIARNIVKRFNQLGKPIVPVHDSFRVWEEDADLLSRVMSQEYVRVMSAQTEFPAYRGQLPSTSKKLPKPRALPTLPLVWPGLSTTPNIVTDPPRITQNIVTGTTDVSPAPVGSHSTPEKSALTRPPADRHAPARATTPLRARDRWRATEASHRWGRNGSTSVT